MKRKVALVLASVMALSMIAGCGSGSDSSSSGSSDSGNSGDKVVMNMTTLNGGTNDVFAEAIQKQLDKFNAENEYNVEIQLECYSNDNYKTKLTTLMASNSQPDIFFTWEAGYLQPFVEGGKVYPVGDIFEADEEWQAVFPDKSVFGPLTYDDKIYAMPNARQICVVAYNKDLLDEANATVPTTYQEFLDTCQKLTDAGIPAFCCPCGEAWYGGQLLQQMCNIIGGSDFYDYTVSDGVEWNNETFVEAGEMLKEMNDNGYLMDGSLGMDPSEGFEKFNNKEVAMMMMITSGVNKVVSDSVAPDQVDFFILPPDDAANAGVDVGSIGQNYAISSQAENPEAAAAFLKQLNTSVEYHQFLTDNSQASVTNLEVSTDNLDPMIIRSSKCFEEMTLYTPWLDRIYGAGEGVEFNNASVAILGGTDPQEAMDNLQQFAIDNAKN